MRFIKTIKSREGRAVEFKKIESQITLLAREFKLDLLYLFGSYALNTSDKLSDLDIAFLSSKDVALDDWLSLLERLEKIFGEEAIDLVDLKKAPLSLIHRVLKEGRCLYAKDLALRIDFETRYEGLYFDSAPLRKEYETYLLKRIDNGSFGYR